MAASQRRDSDRGEAACSDGTRINGGTDHVPVYMVDVSTSGLEGFIEPPSSWVVKSLQASREVLLKKSLHDGARRTCSGSAPWQLPPSTGWHPLDHRAGIRASPIQPLEGRDAPHP